MYYTAAMPLPTGGERQALLGHLGVIPAGAEDPLFAAVPPYGTPPLYDDQYAGDPWVEGWTADLKRWGQEVCTRAALACARLLLPLWTFDHPGDTRLDRAIAAIEHALRTGQPPSLQVSAGISATDREARTLYQTNASRAVRAAFEAVRAPPTSAARASSAALAIFNVLDWSHPPDAVIAWRASLQRDPEFALTLALPVYTAIYATIRLTVRRELLPLLVDPPPA